MSNLSGIIALAVRYCGSSVMCCKYFGIFFNEKYGKKLTFFIWNTVYVLSQFAMYFLFNRTKAVDSILSLAIEILILFLLRRILFYGSNVVSFFAVFSFLAGKELMLSFFVVINYQLLCEIALDFVNYCAEHYVDFFLGYGQLLFNSLDLIIMLLTNILYVIMFWVYLKTMGKNFWEKDHRLQFKENLFLLLPSMASIFISITLRIMEVNSEGTYLEVFEKVPATKFFIPLIDILLLGTNIVSVILFQNLVGYNKEKNKNTLLEHQIEQMQNRIGEIQDIYKDIRGLRHDMKNHIENISLYLKRTGAAEDEYLTEYIGKMNETADRLDFLYNTGNPITDIIIHQKKQEAEKKGIGFKADFTFPYEKSIDAYDLGIILNNALENAVEACEKCGEPYIFIRSYTKGSLYFIECENVFSGKITFADGSSLPLTTKNNPESHGLGLSNIERTAKKYMGGIDIAEEKRDGKNLFVLTVMLHI